MPKKHNLSSCLHIPADAETSGQPLRYVRGRHHWYYWKKHLPDINQDFQKQAVFNISQPNMDHMAANTLSKFLKQIYAEHTCSFPWFIT